MDEDDEERRGFRVTDRRRFSETGEAREGPEAGPPPTEAASAPEVAERTPHSRHVPEEPVTFSTFVLGLSTQALLHLGEIPNPLTRVVERDISAAKHVIDILGVLSAKTRNNLEPGEQSLLDSVLYDLRMRYVELVPQAQKEHT